MDVRGKLVELLYEFYGCDPMYYGVDALAIAQHLTANGVAPVVRCKDCMHYLIVDEFEGGKRYMCKVNHFSYINSDGDMHYCSYGERKEGKAE